MIPLVNELIIDKSIIYIHRFIDRLMSAADFNNTPGGKMGCISIAFINHLQMPVNVLLMISFSRTKGL